MSDVAWWQPHANRATTHPAMRRVRSNGSAAFIAVVIFTFILLLSPQNWFPALAPFRIALMAAGAATVCLLWDRWRQRATLLHINRALLVSAGLAAWAILTLPLSLWPGGSFNILTDPYLKALTIFWLLSNIVTSVPRLRFVAVSLFLCTVPLAAGGLKNFMTGKHVVNGDRILGYNTALTLNPNDMALMLNLVIPLGVAIFLNTTRSSIRIFCLLVIAFDVVGVILTFSRAGFLSLATICVVYSVKLFQRASDRKWAVAVLLLTLVFLPLLPSTYVDRISTIRSIDADPTGSAQARWRDSVAAIHFVTEHPIIGAGIGMDILALNQVRGPQWKQVHNIYLQYAVDLGLPGLIMFLILFWGVFRAARSSRQRAASVPELRSLFLLTEALEVSLIVFLVAGFFHPVAYHFYFFYIGGLALAARSATDDAISRTNLVEDSRPRLSVLTTLDEESRWRPSSAGVIA